MPVHIDISDRPGVILANHTAGDRNLICRTELGNDGDDIRRNWRRSHQVHDGIDVRFSHSLRLSLGFRFTLNFRCTHGLRRTLGYQIVQESLHLLTVGDRSLDDGHASSLSQRFDRLELRGQDGVTGEVGYQYLFSIRHQLHGDFKVFPGDIQQRVAHSGDIVAGRLHTLHHTQPFDGCITEHQRHVTALCHLVGSLSSLAGEGHDQVDFFIHKFLGDILVGLHVDPMGFLQVIDEILALHIAQFSHAILETICYRKIKPGKKANCIYLFILLSAPTTPAEQRPCNHSHRE